MHFQPVGGAAGDMVLAALVAAGAPLVEVSRQTEALDVSFTLHTDPIQVSGVWALRLTVEHPEQHVHRSLVDVQRMVERANLPERATHRAVAAFRLLAKAEGAVHGRPPEEVTFHEVGAVDSIIDVVGSCVALELLDVDTVSCGLLPMGSGNVTSAHGPLPVPGPATLEMLRSSRIRWTEETTETTTPTGAAIMASLTGGEFTEAAPPMTLRAIGYGTGRAALRHAPNLLRAVVGELEGEVGDVALLEANVDDTPGEILGAAVERLLSSGALDAWLEPIVMKKGRGAYKVCALVKRARQEEFAHLLMRETGSLGVRQHQVGRIVAERRTVEVNLSYGSCRIKIGSLDGENFVAAPEYEDAVQLADETGLSLPRVYSDARAAFESGQ
ncbi:MAG TPA: nickel pincer cofactor biosynthesis protein LarC [Rubrobacteraceae bacterium]|nr:nickel pincer cofactor biosynthesis protein LarC [Rubrobacteraceae bacterium]